ncbi:MAG: hypothetical protein ABI661_12655 [Gammaproteobacteria bacterium]
MVWHKTEYGFGSRTGSPINKNVGRRRGITTMVKTKIAASLLVGLTFAATGHANTVSYFLNQSNGVIGGGINYLEVTLSDEGAPGAIEFTVKALQPLLDLAGDKFGITAFGFNVVGGVGAEARNVKELPKGWKAKNGGRMDGFGLFDITVAGSSPWGKGRGFDDFGRGRGFEAFGKGNDDWDDKDDKDGKGDGKHGGKGRAQDPLTFSIKRVDFDTIYSYADLSTGKAPNGWSFFAARVTGLDFDCEKQSVDKKGHGGGSSCSSRTLVFGTSPVPAPPAVWLLGTGLAGLVLRRLRSLRA